MLGRTKVAEYWDTGRVMPATANAEEEYEKYRTYCEEWADSQIYDINDNLVVTNIYLEDFYDYIEWLKECEAEKLA